MAREIGSLYDRAARRDVLKPTALGMRMRGEVLARARGRVLEVGMGTGANLPFYPASYRTGEGGGLTAAEPQLVGVDLSPRSLARARARAAAAGMPLAVAPMDAARLELPDNAFDTVVSTFTLCTLARPADALAEFHRVLHPRGQLLLVEHVRLGGLGWLQDLLTPLTRAWYGCHLGRDTLALLAAGPFRRREERRYLRGAVRGLVLTPLT